MKKIISLLLAAAMLFTLGACAQEPEGTYPKTGRYIFKDADEIYPRLSLEENNEFAIVFSRDFSRITEGTYSVEGDILTLSADDGSVYYFEVNKETLKFNGENSTPFEKAEEDEAEILDGQKFELVREIEQ